MTNDDYEKVRESIEIACARNRRPDLAIKVGIFTRGKFRAFLRGVAAHRRLTWTEPFLAPWELRGDEIAIDAVKHWCFLESSKNLP